MERELKDSSFFFSLYSNFDIFILQSTIPVCRWMEKETSYSFTEEKVMGDDFCQEEREEG
jgi:hypothetical protein